GGRSFVTRRFASRARKVPERIEQAVAHDGIETDVLLAQPAGEGDRRPHLLDVGAAAVAAAQVRLDACAVDPREAPLEVVGDELHELLAAEGVDAHRSCMYLSSARLTRERARCRSTR